VQCVERVFWRSGGPAHRGGRHEASSRAFVGGMQTMGAAHSSSGPSTYASSVACTCSLACYCCSACSPHLPLVLLLCSGDSPISLPSLMLLTSLPLPALILVELASALTGSIELRGLLDKCEATLAIGESGKPERRAELLAADGLNCGVLVEGSERKFVIVGLEEEETVENELTPKMSPARKRLIVESLGEVLSLWKGRSGN
jgi:hypothetical protein